jgi:Na+:H+ antiporter, NhaA family
VQKHDFSKKQKQNLNVFLDSLLGAEFKEIAGGLLLVVATIVSLILANSPIGSSYREFWETPIAISFGQASLSLSLKHWINEGLMTLFFFVVGLEIKREFSIGALSSFKKAAMPIIAAVGGMLVPALIYMWANAGSEKSLSGWAIPTATDIAFVVGVATLFSKRIPAAMLVFLLTLATADDLGAILIIALFYGSAVDYTFLTFAGASIVFLFYLKFLRIYSIIPYILTGILLWFFLLKAGVNADIAGVITAFSIPVFGATQTSRFVEKVKNLTNQFLRYHSEDADRIYARSHKQQEILYLLRKEHDLVHAPSQRLIFSLQNYTTFIIVPLYALANTAIAFDLNQLQSIFQHEVGLGILGGLVIGKPVGIVLFSLIALKLNIAKLPNDLNTKDLLIAGCLGGIGFTMSLFVADLSFASDLMLVNLSKLSVILASCISIFFALVLIFTQPAKKKHIYHNHKPIN